MNRSRLPVVLVAGVAMGLASLTACSGNPATASPPSASPSGQSAPTAPASSAPASPSAPAGTQVITYAPWAAASTLASGISAAATQSGSCFSTSSATTVSGAFRCMVGNNLHDPCFEDATAGAGEVACPSPADPDSVVVIKLTGALPVPDTAASAPLPWLLVLANGQHCETNTGTVGILGGKNQYYECSAGGAYGQPDESGATWTISYAPAGAPASAMTTVTVTQAYE